MTCKQMKIGTEQKPAAAQRRRRVHPLTWVASAMLLPLVCWDVRQAQHDVRLRHEASVQQHVTQPAFGFRVREQPALSRVLASR